MASSSKHRAIALPYLPDEVLVEIFSHLPRDSRLTSFNLVSRRFKNLIEEFLYHTLDVYIRCSREESEAFASDPHPPYDLVRVSKLIDLLSKDYELGLHTRNVAINTAHRALYRFGEQHRLFQCVPKLQHLSLSPPPRHFSIPACLPLQSLQLDFYFLEQSMVGVLNEELSIIAEHFRIPSLRKLQLLNILSTGSHIDALTNFPVPPTREKAAIEDFRVLHCIDGPNTRIIERFLRYIDSLKRFVFTYPMPRQRGTITIGNRAVDIVHFSARSISSGLEFHLDTLEELVLFAADGVPGDPPSINEYFDYKDKTFTKLRKLAVPQSLVLADLARPRRTFVSNALEEIQVQFAVNIGDFRGCNREDESRAEKIDIMDRLAETKKGGALPKLKRVVWWYQPFQIYQGDIPKGADAPLFGSWRHLQGLRRSFERINVKFEWITSALLSETPFGRRLEEPFEAVAWRHA